MRLKKKCKPIYHHFNFQLAIALFGAVQAAPEAEAEADPAVLYGGYYGYGLGYYGGYYGYGLPYYAHAGLPYSYGWTDGPNNGLGPVHALGKREAEAEADPAVLYGGYYGLGYYGGYRGYYGLPYYAHAGLPYSYGWTDGPNNGLGPVYGK